MIKEVNYYPQYVVEETVFNNNYAVISVTDGDVKPDEVVKIVGADSVLRLGFLDIEDKSNNSKYTEFNDVLGRQVYNFVTELHNSNKEYNLVIHCRMGASRSPAIALYVHHITGCLFPGYSDATTPNKLVLKVFEKIENIHISVPEKNQNNTSIFILPKIKVV